MNRRNRFPENGFGLFFGFSTTYYVVISEAKRHNNTLSRLPGTGAEIIIAFAKRSANIELQ